MQKTINYTEKTENLEKINYKKSLGQNFIYDKNLLNAIVKDGDVTGDDVVLEIGAGTGTLTECLAKTAKQVISFEIDKSLMPILIEKQNQNQNIKFYFEDFMQANIEDVIKEKVKVVANIPYYITTPIIFKLVDNLEKFSSVLVLVQKEVAERFSAKSGTKNYGITSVILQSIFSVTMPRVIKKECFTPSPKVDSALCKLVPKKDCHIKEFDKFKNFVHLAFSMRRKTLVNNLKSKYNKSAMEEVLTKFSYPINVRPEDISVENFINIFNLLV